MNVMLTPLLAFLIAFSEFSGAFHVQYSLTRPPFRLYAEGKDDVDKTVKMDSLMSEVEDALNLADEAMNIAPRQQSPPKVVAPVLTAKEKEEALGAGISGALVGAIVANVAANEIPELSVSVDPLLWSAAIATFVGGTAYGVSSSDSMPGTITRSVLGKPTRAIGSALTGAITNLVKSSVSKIQAIPGNIVSSIKKQAERTKNDILSIPGRVEQSVKSTVENTKTAVVNKATTTVNEIKNIPNVVLEAAIEVAEETKEAAQKKAEATIEEIRKIPSAVREAAVEVAEEAIEELKQTPVKIAEASKKAVKETVEGTKQKIVSTVESVVPPDFLKESISEEPKPPDLPPPMPQLENERASISKSVASGIAEDKKEIPKISLPKVEIPKVKIPALEIPKVNIANVALPKVVPDTQESKTSQQQEITELIQAVKSVAAQESAKKLMAKPSLDEQVEKRAIAQQKEDSKKQAAIAAEQERRRAEEQKRQVAAAERQRKELERRRQEETATERRRAEDLKRQQALAEKKQEEMEKAKAAERQRQAVAAAAQEKRQAEELRRQKAAAETKSLQEKLKKQQEEEKRRKQAQQKSSEEKRQESSLPFKTIQSSPSMRVTKPTLKKAPRGVPTIVKWKKRRDGGISGIIYSSPNFDDGDRVETSKITGGLVENGNVVTTESGSRYFLSEEIPTQEDAIEPLKQLLNAIPGATITLTRKAKETESKVAQPKPRPLSTFSLFGAGSGAPRDLLDRSIVSSSNQRAPRGVPTIKRWRKNRDGSVSGYIYGSPSFQDGEKVTTSVIAGGEVSPGEIVRTGSGSRYFLE